MTFVIGYGRGEIEPGIAPLVQAVVDAGYETFSSCEGHPNKDPDFSRFQVVGFYSDEPGARRMHVALRSVRDKLSCSWLLTAVFVLHRTTDEWVLGWRLENAGVIAETDTADEFEDRSVQVGREHDLPILIEMLGALGGAGAPA